MALHSCRTHLDLLQSSSVKYISFHRRLDCFQECFSPPFPANRLVYLWDFASAQPNISPPVKAFSFCITKRFLPKARPFISSIIRLLSLFTFTATTFSDILGVKRDNSGHTERNVDWECSERRASSITANHIEGWRESAGRENFITLTNCSHYQFWPVVQRRPA